MTAKRRRPATSGKGPFIVSEWSLFGWCATNRHEECRVQYISWETEGNTQPTKCKCECHKAPAPKKIRKGKSSEE